MRTENTVVVTGKLDVTIHVTKRFSVLVSISVVGINISDMTIAVVGTRISDVTTLISVVGINISDVRIAVVGTRISVVVVASMSVVNTLKETMVVGISTCVLITLKETIVLVFHTVIKSVSETTTVKGKDVLRITVEVM